MCDIGVGSLHLPFRSEVYNDVESEGERVVVGPIVTGRFLPTLPRPPFLSGWFCDVSFETTLI